MRRFIAYGPSLIVLLTASLTLLGAPAAIRQMEAARTTARVTLAQQRLEPHDELAHRPGPVHRGRLIEFLRNLFQSRQEDHHRRPELPGGQQNEHRHDQGRIADPTTAG